MRTLLTSSSILVALASAAFAPAAFAEEAVRLTPHRAVYDLSLVKGGGPQSVESARGRIVLEFTGDACEGYASKFRQVTVLESGEAGTKTSDLRNATFEDGTGRSFQFKTESLLNGSASEAVDGDAQQHPDGSVDIRLKEPKRDRLTLAGAPLFPTEHMKRVITAARKGESTFTVKVYDGSDDGRKVYDTLAVIGRRIDPGASEGVETASKQEALSKLARWPVTLSYFGPGEGERTPVYVLAFELYENGVSRALRLDYGNFTLKGDVQSLEILPASGCQR